MNTFKIWIEGMDVSEKRKKYLITGLILVLLSLWGGIYDFAALFYGAVFGAGVLWILWKRKSIKIPVGTTGIGLWLITAGYFVSMCIAGDRGIAFLGVMRQLSFGIFWPLWKNIKPDTRECMKESTVRSAIFLTLIAVPGYLVPVVREHLFRAGRLGGVFQYSNTYALFLLVCLIYILDAKSSSWKKYIGCGVLIFGIIFCGSRSVMVLLLGVLGLFLLKGNGRKQILSVVGVTVVLCLILGGIWKSDLARLFQITLDSSTLNGRILYWRDGIEVLKQHPLGLGYMGYYFLQPQFQTGNYVTRYVHNDFLQCGLDAGIISMIVLLVIMIKGLMDRKNTRKNRLILILILLHSLFDFDLQYASIFCIMLMHLGENEKVIERKAVKPFTVVVTGMTVACCYLVFALGLEYFDKNEQALMLYPKNTFSRLALMEEEEDEEQAEKIIEENGMLAAAYECRAKSYLEEENYEQAYGMVKEMLQCAGYDADVYNQSVYYLSFALSQAADQEDQKMERKILKEIQSVPQIVEKRGKSSSRWAYRINDKPEIELDDSVSQYLESVKDIVL